jgi:hypothetical protein
MEGSEISCPIISRFHRHENVCPIFFSKYLNAAALASFRAGFPGIAGLPTKGCLTDAG